MVGGIVLDPIYVPKLFWTMEETAYRLGVSVRTFRELKERHLFYQPDGSRNVEDKPKKLMPLWSDSLVKLIAFARSRSAQGVRELDDDEALQVRLKMEETRRKEYLALVDG